jgi:hypothetical protein
MTVYYAHCMALYGTPQEARDIELLRSLGFKVINPGDPEICKVVEPLWDHNARMAFFEQYADSCDVIAFRALPGGAIPSGVMKEIGWFKERGKPVLELPGFVLRPVLNYEQTKAYLHEAGQR